MNGRRPDACVIGGGLAGITAALRLVDAGMRVTLLEARPELGGATRSLAREGLIVDTGQHVYLRCFTQYRALLRRLGTAGQTALQDRLSVPVVVPGRRPHLLVRARRLPAPAHLLPPLLRYRPLSPAERLRATRAAAALRAVDPDDPATDGQSFGDWLAAHGQRPRAGRRLWDLFTVAALNTRTEQASLALAARVFRTGLLDGVDGGDIGRPLVPLSALHGAPARALLTRLGAAVRTRTRADAVRPEPGGFRVSAGGAELAADAVVVAVPHRAAVRLVPDRAGPAREQWRRLGSAPIVNVHLRYGQRVTDLPFAAAVDSPAQWIFDRSTADMGPEQQLVVSLSAADDLIRRPTGELVATVRTAVGDLFPTARHAPVRHGFVTREPHATFRQVSGTRAWRPPGQTRLAGLALAGAWTDTGWPDTMEGAVRSGHRAADVIVAQLEAQQPRPEEAIR